MEQAQGELIDKVTHRDPALTEISLLSFVIITEEWTIRLIDGLKQNPHVRQVNFVGIPRTPAVFRELASLFGGNKAIERATFPRGIGNEQFAPIARSLQANKTVKILIMSWGNLCGREAGEMIGMLILHNPNITEIDVSNNRRLGPNGATRIAQALLRRGKCALKRLDLSCCDIEDEGMFQLCISLRRNDSCLEEISICDNDISDAGKTELAKSLPDMKGLIKLRFSWSDDEVSMATVRSMVKGLHQNDSLLYVRGEEADELPDEGQLLWETWSEYITARNKMNPILRARGNEAAADVGKDSNATTTPLVPPGLWPCLLDWCNARRTEHEVVKASLIYVALCARVNDAFGTIETGFTETAPSRMLSDTKRRRHA